MAQEPHHDKTRSKAQNKRAGPEPEEYRIRQRAYEIWVEEGRPDGRALDDWMLARQELEWTPDPDADLEQVAQEFEPGCKTLEILAASLKDEGGFYFAPSRSAIEGSKGRKIESVAISEAAEGGSVLKLTGGDPSAPSSGFTGGFSIRVADAFECQASEHTVRVRVLARSGWRRVNPDGDRLFDRRGGELRLAMVRCRADVVHPRADLEGAENDQRQWRLYRAHAQRTRHTRRRNSLG